MFKKKEKLKFSIRKYKTVGTQSVLVGIATLVGLFLGNTSEAEEVVVLTASDGVADSISNNELKSTYIVESIENNEIPNETIPVNLTSPAIEAEIKTLNDIPQVSSGNGEINESLINTQALITTENSSSGISNESNLENQQISPIINQNLTEVSAQGLPSNDVEEIASINFERADSGKDPQDFIAKTGEGITLYTNIEISGIDNSIEDAYILFTIMDSDSTRNVNYKISDLNNQTVNKLSEGVYKLFLGNLISGSTLSLPITIGGGTGENGYIENGMTVSVLAQLFDSTNNLHAENTVITQYKSIASLGLPKPTLSLYKNDSGELNGVPVVGYVDAQTGTIFGRSNRTYSIKPDATFLENVTKFFGDQSLSPNYGGLADGYTIRVSLPSDQIGKWVLSSNNTLNLYKDGNESLKTKGYFDITIDGPNLNNINSTFTLNYSGADVTIPDTTLSLGIYKNGLKVDSVDEYILTHKNTLVTKEIPIVRDIAISTYISSISRNSPMTKWHSGFDYGNDITLTSINSNPMIFTSTKFINTTAYPDELGIPVNNIGVNIPTQADGDRLLSTVTITGFYTEKQGQVNSSYWNDSEAILYYIDNLGNKTIIDNLENYYKKYSFTKPLVLQNVSYIGISFKEGYQLFNTKMIGLVLSADTITEDFLSNNLTEYSSSTTRTQIIDKNVYRYTAEVSYKPNTTLNEYKTATYKSNLAGFTKEEFNFDTRIDNVPTGALIGQTGYIYMSNVASPASNFVNPIVDESAYLFIAVPQNLKIEPSKFFSQLLNLKEIKFNKDNSGLDFYIYEFLHNEITPNIDTRINYTINPEIFFNSIGSTVLNSKVVTGVVFRADSRYIGNEEDPLDIDNDGQTTATGDKRGDVFVVSKAMDFSAVSPKALFIFDKTSGRDGVFDFNKNDVYAGDVITISPQIGNTTDQPYENITVITVLPREGDVNYNGDSSRGSQFTPTIVEPSNVPDGWQVKYSTVIQKEGMVASEITDWKLASEITDWTKITALKWESNPGYKLNKGEIVNFNYKLKIPDTALLRQYIVTTSSISVNGSTQYLEGYRSITSIKNYAMKVTGRVFIDQDNNGQYDDNDFPLSGVFVQIETVSGELVLEGESTGTTSIDGKYSLDVPYPNTPYKVRFILRPNGGETVSDSLTYYSAPFSLDESDPIAVRDLIVSLKQKARFIYIDQDNGNSELSRQEMSGVTGDAIGYDAKAQLATYLKAGYVLISGPQSYDPTQTYSPDSTDIEEFVYILGHGSESVTDSQEVTRVINYVYEGGETASPSHSDKVSFSRIGQRDKVTGEITYGAWTSQDAVLDGVSSPVIIGYHADKTQVAEQEVVAEASDIVEVVTYAKDGQKARFIYIDQDNGNSELSRQEMSGVTGDAIGYDAKAQLATYLKAGYVLISGPQSYDPTQTYSPDSTDIEEFVYILGHGSESVTDSQEVTRVINYVYEGGETASPSHSDKVSFSRIGQRDKVTGEITYGAWTSQDAVLDGVSSPVIIGYHADKTQVAEQEVVAEASDIVEVVTYAKDGQKARFIYIDQDNGNSELSRQEMSGVTGDAIGYDAKAQLATYLKAGYVLISGPQSYDPTQTYSPDSTDIEEFVYILGHGSESVTDSQEVTRVINYVYEGGETASPSHSDKVSFSRIGQRDKVTGEITYGAWTSQDAVLDGVSSPVIIGYHADKTQVAEQEVVAEASDIVEVVTYAKDGQKARFIYIDQDNGNSELSRQEMSGVTGDAIGYDAKAQLATYLKAGYVLISGPQSYDPTQTYSPDSTDIEEFVYILGHGSESVTDSQEVTRVINYVYEGGETASPSHSDKVSFSRIGQRDKVTGEITYGAWTSQDAVLDGVSSPVIIGYHADKTQVAEQEVVAEASDIVEVVTYAKDGQKARFIYIDQDNGNSELSRQEMSGVTGDAIGYDAKAQLATYLKAGYVLISGPQSYDPTQTYSPDSTDIEEFVYILGHGSESVTDSQEVTRVINYVYEGGETASPSHSDKVSFSRIGQRDKVTGEITYGAWTSQDAVLDGVSSPVIIGYHADKTQVAEQEVVAEASDIVEVVTYAKDGQKARFIYIDQDNGNSELSRQEMSGVTGDAIGYDAKAQLATYLKAGYVLISGPQSYDPTQTYSPDSTDIEEFVYILGHGSESVTDSQEVTRVINYVYEGGETASPSHSDKVSFSRIGQRDKVTGEITYGAWTSQDAVLDGVSSPVIIGYHADKTQVAEQEVVAEASDIVEVVTYAKDGQKARFIYIDQDNGNSELSRQEMSGVTGDAIGYDAKAQLATYLKAGYVLISGPQSYDPTQTYSPDSTDIEEFVYILGHGSESVTDSQEVTRVINYVYEGGETASPSHSDKVSFSRIGQRDKVTGEITYGAWTSQDAVLDGVSSPVIIGYHADKTQVAEQEVVAEASDIVEVVTYAKDGQKARFIYIDQDNGNSELSRQEMSGVTGDAIGYDAKAQLATYLKAGYVLISGPQSYDPTQTYSPDSTDIEEFVYILGHGSESVTDSQEVTRVINYVYEGGETASPSHSDKVSFSRIGQRDKVTGEITYGAWTSQDAVLDGVSSPVIIGYHADKTQVAEQEVVAEASDIVEVVTYAKDGQKARFIYIDQDNGNSELSCQEMSGVTGDAIGYDAKAQLATYLKAGYVLISGPQSYDPTQTYSPDSTDIEEFVYILGHGSESVTDSQEVTRVINYVYEGGETASPSHSDKVSFSRIGQRDKVTGEITYGAWTSQDAVLDGVSSPVIIGYHADKTQVAEQEVVAEASDIVEVVTYAKDGQKARFIYIDQDNGNSELSRQEMSGVTGDAIGYDAKAQLATYLKAGYVLISGPQSYDPTQTYSPDSTDIEEFVYILGHGSESVTDSQEVTRVINYVYEGGETASPSHSDKVSFSRIGQRDKVTGEITYGAWTSQDAVLDGVSSPVIIGYHADKTQVAEQEVVAEASDIVEVVTYKKQITSDSVISKYGNPQLENKSVTNEKVLPHTGSKNNSLANIGFLSTLLGYSLVKNNRKKNK